MDIDLNKKPWVKILLHSMSFHKIEDFSNFLELNLTEYVEIDVTPTENSEFINFFKKFNISVPKYEISNGSIAMYYDNGFKNTRFHHNNYGKQLAKCNSMLSNEDILMSSDYDFFILSDADEYLTFNQIKNSSTINDVKKYIRILFSNNNIYLYRYNHEINEGYYYLIRFKTIFKCYQEPWSLIVNLRDSYPLLFENMNSLSTRLNFIYRAYEKAAYFSLKKANNDTSDNTLYHLGFFMMLCTGAFDDMAWMINNIYTLNLHKKHVTLRGKRFKNKVKEHNIDLFYLLSDNMFANTINVFYPIRDSLQHRNYLSGYILQSGASMTHMIYLDEESANLIDKPILSSGNDVGFGKGMNKNYSVNPNDLLEYMMQKLVDIVESIYLKIDWKSFKNQLSGEDKKNIESSMQQFNEGIGKFFNFPGDSMYL